MMKLTWWKRSLMVGCVVIFTALASKPWQVQSAEPVQVGQVGQYNGSTFCKKCHEAPSSKPTDDVEAKKFIRLDEWTIWNKDDKHSLAYANLNSERGQQMATFLHVQDVTRPEVGCVGCHGASRSEYEKRVEGTKYEQGEGVSCENCHGPFSGWLAPHLDPAFRTLKTVEWTKLGFIDLRSAEGKSEKCLSCHIGNVEEKKVVTHEMYAAGHPPLPSIEVASFANSIPRHWSLNSERTDEKVKKSLGYEEGQLEQTKLAIVGAAVALKTSLKLVADEAKFGAPGQAWPDYARFDCWSCHHDLQRPGWRQERGFKDGPPGRVPVSEWPLTLVEVGIERLVLDDKAAEALRTELKGHEKVLRDEANIRPFGRKDSLGQAAEDYAKWTEVLIKKLGASRFDKEVAKTLLRKLVENAEVSTPDFDSARHVAWTIKLLVDELGTSLANRSQIVPILGKFDAGLKLDLPSGRFYEIEKQMGEALKVIGDYDPANFKGQLGELLKLIP